MTPYCSYKKTSEGTAFPPRDSPPGNGIERKIRKKKSRTVCAYTPWSIIHTLAVYYIGRADRSSQRTLSLNSSSTSLVRTRTTTCTHIHTLHRNYNYVKRRWRWKKNVIYPRWILLLLYMLVRALCVIKQYYMRVYTHYNSCIYYNMYVRTVQWRIRKSWIFARRTLACIL